MILNSNVNKKDLITRYMKTLSQEDLEKACEIESTLNYDGIHLIKKFCEIDGYLQSYAISEIDVNNMCKCLKINMPELVIVEKTKYNKIIKFENGDLVIKNKHGKVVYSVEDGEETTNIYSRNGELQYTSLPMDNNIMRADDMMEQSYIYDSLGRIKESLLYTGNMTTSYEYDDRHNKINYSKRSDGVECWWDLDDDGNIIHHKSTNGDNIIFESWHEFENGKQIHSRNCYGYENWSKYDVTGNLIMYENTDGHVEFWEYVDLTEKE